MKQTRLCSWYRPPCRHLLQAPPPQTSFLSLPEKLRFHVYESAGLITGSYVHVTNVATCDLRFCEGSRNSEGAALFYNIRLVSVDVHASVSQFILQENTVLLVCESPAKLLQLLKMSESFFKSLRKIIVHWRAPYRPWEPCPHSGGEDPEHCYICYQNHLHVPCADRDDEFLMHWRSVGDRLASLSGLELQIACDAEDQIDAYNIVRPIEKMQLNACTIRTTFRRNPGLERIARQAVQRSLVTPARTERFNFLDLPPELRQHILSFTDLVAPYRRVKWNPKQGFLKWLPPSGDDPDRPNCKLPEFCGRRVTVYPDCRCWWPPKALFVVSQRMLPDVRSVFWSLNTFSVEPWQSHQLVQFEASTFLRNAVPKSSLCHLRSLEIWFPGRRYDFFGNVVERDFYFEWVRTVELVAPYLKNLRLRVRISLYWEFEPYSYFSDLHWRSKDEDSALLWRQEQVVKPLALWNSALGSLQFHVISRPNYWTSIGRQKQEFEQYLRGLVLGGEYKMGSYTSIEEWER